MSRYDRDQDGMLRFADFCEIFAPKNPPKEVQKMIKDKCKLVPESIMGQEEMEEIKVTLELAIKVEMDLEMIRFRIASLDNENEESAAETVFKQISGGEKKIAQEKVKEFIKE